MIIMSFDLSSVCIGVTAAEIDNNTLAIKKMRSCPIIPKQYSAIDLGYMKSKKPLLLKNGEKLITYYKAGETTITKTEKARRDREVRGAKDIFVLREISKSINDLVSKIKPDLILAEKNEIFNGILTSVLLGKVMGALVSITGVQDIPFKETKVGEARSSLDMKQILIDFRSEHTAEYLQQIPDVTKRAIREHLSKLYAYTGIIFLTDDESDSCVIFHNWYVNLKKGDISYDQTAGKWRWCQCGR